MKGFNSQVNLGNNEIKTKFNGFSFSYSKASFFPFFKKNVLFESTKKV